MAIPLSDDAAGGKRLRMRIVLPRPLTDIQDEIIWRTIQLFGTQKLAARNLGVSEAMISHRMNYRRKGIRSG